MKERKERDFFLYFGIILQSGLKSKIKFCLNNIQIKHNLSMNKPIKHISHIFPIFIGMFNWHESCITKSKAPETQFFFLKTIFFKHTYINPT